MYHIASCYREKGKFIHCHHKKWTHYMIYILFIYLLFCCLASAGKQLSLSFCFYEYAIFHNTFLSDFLDVWKIRFWSAFNVASCGLTQKSTGKVNTFIKQCIPGTKVAKVKQYMICTYHFYSQYMYCWLYYNQILLYYNKNLATMNHAIMHSLHSNK